MKSSIATALIIFVVLALGYFSTFQSKVFSIKYSAISEPEQERLPSLDKALYDKKMLVLANNPIVGTSSTSTITTLWPVKADYPRDGAILPFKRIVAYYGNFYSEKMGALGEYAPDDMLHRLQAETAKWTAADPDTPAIPALHYIAVTAQGAAGEDGMYRLRMPGSQIDKALELAKQIDGLVFLDIQVGLSTLPKEVPLLENYLKLPNVHLGIDPEFSMKSGDRPGTVIGTFNAQDINYTINYLAKIVKENNLPPKVLVVHRFTQNMITDYANILRVPEVQIVINMDGWGPPGQKFNTYKSFIYPEPVQFAGFKLFYKNDLKLEGGRLLTPGELLDLRPRPIYIQYQ